MLACPRCAATVSPQDLLCGGCELLLHPELAAEEYEVCESSIARAVQFAAARAFAHRALLSGEALPPAPDGTAGAGDALSEPDTFALQPLDGGGLLHTGMDLGPRAGPASRSEPWRARLGSASGGRVQAGRAQGGRALPAGGTAAEAWQVARRLHQQGAAVTDADLPGLASTAGFAPRAPRGDGRGAGGGTGRGVRPAAPRGGRRPAAEVTPLLAAMQRHAEAQPARAGARPGPVEAQPAPPGGGTAGPKPPTPRAARTPRAPRAPGRPQPPGLASEAPGTGALPPRGPEGGAGAHAAAAPSRTPTAPLMGVLDPSLRPPSIAPLTAVSRAPLPRRARVARTASPTGGVPAAPGVPAAAAAASGSPAGGDAASAAARPGPAPLHAAAPPAPPAPSGRTAGPTAAAAPAAPAAPAALRAAPVPAPVSRAASATEGAPPAAAPSQRADAPPPRHSGPVPLARIATRKVPVLVGRGEALVAAMAPAALQRDAAPAHAQARAADAPGAPDVPPAIRLGPRTPLELVRQAQHLERMGSRAAAMATLERVVRLVRRPAPLYNKLGLLALQSPRDPERAVEYLRRAVELDPDSSTFVQNLQRALVELRPLHTVAAGAH